MRNMKKHYTDDFELTRDTIDFYYKNVEILCRMQSKLGQLLNEAQEQDTYDGIREKYDRATKALEVLLDL